MDPTDEAVAIGTELIAKTKQQMELIGRALPSDHPGHHAMRLVYLKLDEARLWLGEVAR